MAKEEQNTPATPEDKKSKAVLFIVIGTLMVLGFGVLLVTKLRISKMSI